MFVLLILVYIPLYIFWSFLALKAINKKVLISIRRLSVLGVMLCTAMLVTHDPMYAFVIALIFTALLEFSTLMIKDIKIRQESVRLKNHKNRKKDGVENQFSRRSSPKDASPIKSKNATSSIRSPRTDRETKLSTEGVSIVKTKTLDLMIKNGAMIDGTITYGTMSSQSVASLSPRTIANYYELIKNRDPIGARYLQVYLTNLNDKNKPKAEINSSFKSARDKVSSNTIRNSRTSFNDRRHSNKIPEDSDSGTERSYSRKRANTSITTQEAYRILGLTERASSEEIRQAHRRLMKRTHPDQGGSVDLAAKVNLARDCLLNR